jgi:uncharacterized OsmC-like protein
MCREDITHIKDFRFNVQSGDYECVIDARGKQALTLPGALLASLGSCIGVYLRKYAETAGLNLLNFKITVEAEFSKIPLFLLSHKRLG